MNTSANAIPYWRLSAFYAFYFSIVGALIPYLGLYLQSLQYSAKEIGFIAAILMATKIVAPSLWGWLGDATGKRLGVIRLGCLLAAVSFAGIYVDQRFFWLAWVFGFYTFFWNAVLPQFEVITLDHLGDKPQHYSKVRVWGSLGFVSVVMGLGWMFDFIDIAYLPHIVLGFSVLVYLSSLTIKEAVHRELEHTPLGFREILRKPAVYSFLIASFLLQVSHGPYYAFYSLYLESYGYSRTSIGVLWALGAIAEVGIFLIMHRLMPRVGMMPLFIGSMAITTGRWFLIACFPESVPIIIFAQTLHAFSFGCAHAVAIEWARRYFPGRHQGQGQAIHISVSFGVGGALGAVVAGFMWEDSPVMTFAFSSFMAALALLVAWWGSREPSPELDLQSRNVP